MCQGFPLKRTLVNVAFSDIRGSQNSRVPSPTSPGRLPQYLSCEARWMCFYKVRPLQIVDTAITHAAPSFNAHICANYFCEVISAAQIPSVFILSNCTGNPHAVPKWPASSHNPLVLPFTNAGKHCCYATLEKSETSYIFMYKFVPILDEKKLWVCIILLIIWKSTGGLHSYTVYMKALVLVLFQGFVIHNRWMIDVQMALSCACFSSFPGVLIWWMWSGTPGCLNHVCSFSIHQTKKIQNWSQSLQQQRKQKLKRSSKLITIYLKQFKNIII